jgi:SAM-dependent methyltransferase
MSELTKKTYWSAKYDGLLQFSAENKRSAKDIFIRFAERMGAAHLVKYMYSYNYYLLWNVIFPKYMPNKAGAKVLEIGSAPGHALVEMNRRFGFVPYGVEYSEPGVELNRRIFAANNLDPANVIHADFFSEQFDKQYKASFDIVMSRGFIEHFDNVEYCVKKHVDLLTERGRLVIIIPNLRGMNYILARLFNPDSLRMHNLEIMRRGTFNNLFSEKRLKTLFCGYAGTFDFKLFNTDPNSPMRFVLAFCIKAQHVLNVFLRLLFGNKGAETKMFSPYLLFIGEKRSL